MGKTAERMLQREKKERLQEAMDQFKQGFAIVRSAASRHDLETAIEFLSVAVSLRPSCGRYHSVRGSAFRALGENQRAFFDYSAASRLEPRNVMHLCNRGIALRKLRRFDEAMSDLRHALDIEPSNGTLLFNLGLVLFEMGKYDDAVAHFQSTIATGKQLFKAHFNLANCYRRLERVEDAAVELRTAVGLNPDSGTAHNSLGLSLCEMGDYDGALASFNQAIALSPQNPIFLNNRALARYHLQDLPNAIKDLDEALALGGQDCTAYYHRGNALLAAGRPREALSDLQQALDQVRADRDAPDAATAAALAVSSMVALGGRPKRRNSVVQARPPVPAPPAPEEVVEEKEPSPRSPRLWQPFGTAEEEEGTGEGEEGKDGEGGGGGGGPPPDPSTDSEEDEDEDDEGDDVLEKAGASDEKSSIGADFSMVESRIQHSIGLAHQALTSFDRALAYFLDALSAWQHLTAARYHAGLMFHALGRHEEAETNLTRVLEEEGEERRVREARGLARQAQEKHRLALEDFSAAIAGDETRGEPYYHRAVSYLALGDPSSTIRDMDKALENGWRTVEVYDTRASAHQQLGLVDNAIDDYTGALSLDKANPELLCKRSQCMRKVGEFARAEHDLSSALEAKPRSAEYCFLRALARYEIDNFDGTVSDMRTALHSKADPSIRPDCYYYIGLAYANTDRHDLAVTAFTQALNALDLLPSPVEGKRLAYTHERAKSRQLNYELEDALADFTAVLEMNPGNAHARFRRGFAYKSLKMYSKAAEDFEEARALAPTNPHLVVNYSRLHEVECIVLCAAGEEPRFPDDPAEREAAEAEAVAAAMGGGGGGGGGGDSDDDGDGLDDFGLDGLFLPRSPKFQPPQPMVPGIHVGDGARASDKPGK